MSPSLCEPGKPHVFLLEDPAREKEHYARFASCIEAADELSPLIDAVYEAVLNHALSAQAIQAIQAAVRSRFKVVHELAAKRLVQLAHYYPKAADLLRQLAQNPNASVRLRIVQAVWSERPPIEDTVSLLRNGLRDKSAAVRQFASMRILHCDLHELAPDLEAALSSEQNPKTRHEMAHDLALLCHGYYTKSSDDSDETELVVKMERGFAARIIPSKDCSPEMVQRLVREMQDQDLTRHRPKG